MPKQYPFYYTVYSVLRLRGSLVTGFRKTFWLSFLICLYYLYMLGSSEGLAFKTVLQLDHSPLILCYHLPSFWHLPIFLTKSEDSEVSGTCLSPEAKLLNQ